MNPRSSQCEAVVLRASDYLDGRLPGPARARIQAHLKACPGCLHEYRSLKRLTRAAAALPETAPARGLARRVRRTVALRRQRTLSHLGDPPLASRAVTAPSSHWRLLGWAVAASFVLGVSLFAGYRLGQHEEHLASGTIIARLQGKLTRAYESLAASTDPRTPAHSPATASPAGIARQAPSPGSRGKLRVDRGAGPGAKPAHGILASAWEPYSERGFRPLPFLLSARTLWNDLAILDRFQEDLRLPLIRSQIEYFGLARQARLWRQITAETAADPPGGFAAVVDFIQQVLKRLDADSGQQGLMDLRRRVLASPPFEQLRDGELPTAATPFEHPQLTRLVSHVAPELPQTSRDSLIDALRLKGDLIDGRIDDSLPVIVRRLLHETRGSASAQRDPFAISSRLTLAGYLLDSGQDQLAQTLLDEVSIEKGILTRVRISIASGRTPNGMHYQVITRDVHRRGSAVGPVRK